MHIHFGHCYKGQAGWSQILTRFHKGGGTLYDVEFLTDTSGRRVAAFGYHAGFAGAACGALALAAKKSRQTLGALEPYPTETSLVEEVRQRLGGSGKGIRALVIGALGRCGRGAVDLFRKIGLDEYVPPFPGLFAFSIERTSERTSSSGTWQRPRRAGHSRKSWTWTYSSIASICPRRSRLS